jgi:hypothetical protein
MLTGLPDLSKGSVANPTTYNIVTSEEAATIMPEHIAELWLGYGGGLTMLDILTYGFDNRSELVTAESWIAHTENFPIKTMTVGGNVSAAGGAGQTASFSLAAADLTGANYHYYPRVDQVCFIGSKGAIKQAHIRSISQVTSTVTITIQPSDINYTITAADIAVGVVIPLGPVVKSVESAATTATRNSYDTLTFYAQVVKHAKGFGGMELARQHWFHLDGRALFSDALAKAEFELKAGMNASIFLGEQVTNTAITNVSVEDSSSIQVNSSIGLWTWGDIKGFDITYNGTTGFTPLDLDAEGEYYRSVGAVSNNILKTCGNGYYVSVENGCKDFITGASGALNDLFTPNAGGGDKDLTIGFKSIYKNGFKYILHEDHTFNNPYLLQKLMFNNCISIPLSTVTDAKTGGKFPNISIKYVGNKTYNRKMVIGHIGGMDGAMQQFFGFPVISSSDANSSNWLTHYGLETRDPWNIVRSYQA